MVWAPSPEPKVRKFEEEPLKSPKSQRIIRIEGHYTTHAHEITLSKDLHLVLKII